MLFENLEILYFHRLIFKCCFWYWRGLECWGMWNF